MAPAASSPTTSAYTSPKYFTTTFPSPFVAHVEISRPNKLNAFIEPMWLELPPLFSALSSDPEVRAIILSGAGSKAFTTGLDVQAASSSPQLGPFGGSPSSSPQNSNPPDPARTAHALREHILSFQSCLTALTQCRKPIISAIHGYCLGLGIDLALSTDVRICSPSTSFSVKEVDIGLAADIGTLSRLPKVVGNGSWIKDICLSARMFNAEEARREGLVSWAGEPSPPPPPRKNASAEPTVRATEKKHPSPNNEEAKDQVLAEALQWCQAVASKSPVAVQGTKELLDWSWDRSVADGLLYTAVWNSVALQSGDVGEAMRAGMERRRGRFEKL